MLYKKRGSIAGTVAIIAGADAIGAAVGVVCSKFIKIPCLCQKEHSCWDDIEFDDDDEDEYDDLDDAAVLYPADAGDSAAQEAREESDIETGIDDTTI